MRHIIKFLNYLKPHTIIGQNGSGYVMHNYSFQKLIQFLYYFLYYILQINEVQLLWFFLIGLLITESWKICWKRVISCSYQTLQIKFRSFLILISRFFRFIFVWPSSTLLLFFNSNSHFLLLNLSFLWNSVFIWQWPYNILFGAWKKESIAFDLSNIKRF